MDIPYLKILVELHQLGGVPVPFERPEGSVHILMATILTNLGFETDWTRVINATSKYRHMFGYCYWYTYGTMNNKPVIGFCDERLTKAFCNDGAVLTWLESGVYEVRRLITGQTNN